MAFSEIERTILSYLIEERKPYDTFKGLADYWIERQVIKIQVAHVKRALDNLVRERFVLLRERKDGKTHYQINPKKKHRILILLKDG